MTIQSSNFTTKQQLHEYIKEELNFPDYYGKNLDALFDLLTERSEETIIVIKDYDSLIKNFGSYADAFIDTISDAAKENENIKLTVE